MMSNGASAGPSRALGLDSAGAVPIFSAMSVTRELRRRVSADRPLARFEPAPGQNSAGRTRLDS
jgi:hypothetical protein